MVAYTLRGMPTIIFSGRVTPKSIHVSLATLRIEVGYGEGTTVDGLQTEFEFSIKNSVVEVRCHLNRFLERDYNHLVALALEVARSSVDLMAFSTGIGISLTIDMVTFPDGSSREVYHHDLLLPPLCTAFRTDGIDSGFSEVLSIVIGDRDIMMALNDLTSTMAPLSPRARINCARAVEALARIISRRGTKPPQRLPKISEALNLSKDYIESVTQAKGPRHGDYFVPLGLPMHELRARAWTVMNRFLEFRKRGSASPLPTTEFPLL